MMYVDEKKTFGGKSSTNNFLIWCNFSGVSNKIHVQQLASKIKPTPWKLKIEAQTMEVWKMFFPFQKIGEFLGFPWRFFHDVPCSKYFRSFHGTAMVFFG